jgi:uncharacterized protein (TIGR00369 family)
MTDEDHFEKLKSMYTVAPINQDVFVGSEMKIENEYCQISYPIDKKLFHAGGGLHGAIYFKLLDDSAYFAAATTNRDVFLLTKSYEIQFLRPITGGEVVATGRFVSREGRELVAKSVLTVDGKIVGKGSGVFAYSKMPLDATVGYK